MSTIKVNKIENTSTTNGGVSIDNDGHVTIDGQQLPTAGPLSNRNLIINGAMQVAQRGTSSTSAGYQTVDRFQSTYAGITQTQSQESLTTGDPYDEGFRYFYRVTNTSTSSASSAISELQQRIEGQNINQSGWNFKSSSSYLTISFWVRSSLAGTYYFYIYSPQTASIGYYRIPFTLSANTWTKVTHAIPGNSGITINNDSGIGLHCYWIPYYGTDYTGSTALTEQWDDKDGNDYIPDFAQNWCNTASATFDITGVQLEVGSKSTPFEHRSYADELLRCQRYCYQISAIDETTTHLPIAVGTMWAADFFIGICNTPVSIRNPFDVDLEVSDIGDVFVLSRGTVATPTTLNNNPHHYGNQIEVHFTVSKTIGDGAWARLKPGLGNFFRIISEL